MTGHNNTHAFYCMVPLSNEQLKVSIGRTSMIFKTKVLNLWLTEKYTTRLFIKGVAHCKKIQRYPKFFQDKSVISSHIMILQKPSAKLSKQQVYHKFCVQFKDQTLAKIFSEDITEHNRGIKQRTAEFYSRTPLGGGKVPSYPMFPVSHGLS